MRKDSSVYDRSQDVDKILNEMRRDFGLPPWRRRYTFPSTLTPRESPYKKGQAIGEIKDLSDRHKLEMSRNTNKPLFDPHSPALQDDGGYLVESPIKY